MAKTYQLLIEEETYEMTMEEMAGCLTRNFAKEVLSAEDFEEFVKTQDELLERQRKEVEEYARTHYIPDELRDAI